MSNNNKAHVWMNEDGDLQIEAQDPSSCDISHALIIPHDPKMLWDLIETLIRVANDEDGEPWNLCSEIYWMKLKEGEHG